MIIAVMGKGGSGKTTTAAVLARSLARDAERVLALDCDTNPNLGISLGLGVDRTEALAALRERVGEEEDHAQSLAEFVDRFGTDAPGGVRMAVVNRIEDPEPG